MYNPNFPSILIYPNGSLRGVISIPSGKTLDTGPISRNAAIVIKRPRPFSQRTLCKMIRLNIY